ncbi:MAG: penicillin-binding protein 2 [Ruminococcus sp.]|nr:penicillin-binding protein 2 [Ruminococcus sp.]
MCLKNSSVRKHSRENKNKSLVGDNNHRGGIFIMFNRLAVIYAILAISLSAVFMRLYTISTDGGYSEAAAAQSSYTLTVERTNGTIYDCNMIPLNNCNYSYTAAVSPDTESISAALRYAVDKNEVREKMKSNLPFLCKVTTDEIYADGVRVFSTVSRTDENQLATHIIGYTRDGEGISGLEYVYDDILRSSEAVTKVTFEIDGLGKTLGGYDITTDYHGNSANGIVTTIDSDIQRITEEAISEVTSGAAVVMTKTGELRAVVSVPDYNPLDIAAGMEDDSLPLMNRAFMSYNVGSIFKLVTAATAIEQGISPESEYECQGYIDLKGQRFRCHKLSGHGVITMAEAMRDSCNTYFIALSEGLDSAGFVDTAKRFGFGTKTNIANGMTSAAGNLQTAEELSVPAEKANLSFGQGKLTATPIQITQMTAAIANGGKLYEPKLVSGIIEDGEFSAVGGEVFTKAVEPLTAYELRRFMELAVEEGNSDNGMPDIVTAAGKTSTAQTGRYDENGNEEMVCWFTGYFPAENPEYIVTVLVENGETGNTSAAPVFKEIAEEIVWLERGNVAVPTE